MNIDSIIFIITSVVINLFTILISYLSLVNDEFDLSSIISFMWIISLVNLFLCAGYYIYLVYFTDYNNKNSTDNNPTKKELEMEKQIYGLKWSMIAFASSLSLFTIMRIIEWILISYEKY